MKTYIFINYKTGERMPPVAASSLIEASKIIGIGHSVFTITK